MSTKIVFRNIHMNKSERFYYIVLTRSEITVFEIEKKLCFGNKKISLVDFWQLYIII